MQSASKHPCLPIVNRSYRTRQLKRKFLNIISEWIFSTKVQADKLSDDAKEEDEE